jgi:8-oxo-dGTP pyrophosphatase MutT (NUDIX family)
MCTSDGTSLRVFRCELALSTQPWGYAERYREAIAAYWQRVSVERPKLFDGCVFVLMSFALREGILSGTFARTDFKSFLYWREHGAEGPAIDAFGSSLIRSSDGCVLLGRQAEGHLNAGFAYPPSGMIDPHDAIGGAIDIDRSIARELEEETGLTPADLERQPGYVVTIVESQISIAIEWQSALPAAALRERILARVARQSDPELADIVIVRSLAEVEDRTILPYARAKLRLALSA